MNHSCTPNVEYKRPMWDSTLYWIASQDIKKGEELNFAYIGGMRRERRRDGGRREEGRGRRERRKEEEVDQCGTRPWSYEEGGGRREEEGGRRREKLTHVGLDLVLDRQSRTSRKERSLTLRILEV
jgi:hypothetical protein